MTNDRSSKRKKQGLDIKNDTPDLLEPILDEASEKLSRELFGAAMPELIKNLPVLRSVKTAGDIYSAFRIHKLQKRMTRFLHSLIEGLFSIDQYQALSDEERQLILDILVTELDSQTDDMQSEALALLFNAYVRKNVDRLMFHGVAHELKGVNPLTFYFGVDGFNLSTIKAGTIIRGPLHYLPASFHASYAEGIQFSNEEFLTNLGQTFFTIIYEPMQQKYSI